MSPGFGDVGNHPCPASQRDAPARATLTHHAARTPSLPAKRRPALPHLQLLPSPSLSEEARSRLPVRVGTRSSPQAVWSRGAGVCCHARARAHAGERAEAVPSGSVHPGAGCPIQALLGWESTIPSQPLSSVARCRSILPALPFPNAIPALFHQRHLGRLLRSSGNDRGRRLAPERDQEPRAG